MVCLFPTPSPCGYWRSPAGLFVTPWACSPHGFSVLGGSPGKNTGVGCHALLQGIFPTQGLNPGLLHCRQILYHLSHQGSPRFLKMNSKQWLIYIEFLSALPRLIIITVMRKRSNQSILKEISPEYSLEGLMLKLKLQYFGHLMQRTASLEKILMLGKIGWEKGKAEWEKGTTAEEMVEWHQRLNGHEFE